MAVELTKVALWIETVDPGLPLGFFDAQIRCGDALLGVFDLTALEQGIPDAAYKVLTGDDKAVARHYAAKNRREKAERDKVASGFGFNRQRDFTREFAELRAMPEETLADVEAKAARLNDLTRKRGASWILARGCDLYVSAFLQPKTKDERFAQAGGLPRRGTETVPTSGALWEYLRGVSPFGPMFAAASDAAASAYAFHWPLEFPDVMARGGFDVVLGNPPWERIKLQEKEFFASRDAGIATAANKAARDRLIRALAAADPGSSGRKLFDAFEAEKRMSEATSTFVRVDGGEAGRFPLTGTGDVNTYALFAELFSGLAGSMGRAGVIVPTGIATDATTAPFFAHLVEEKRLAKLVDFENSAPLFPGVHRSFKFCLLTLGRNEPEAHFAFFLTGPAQLAEPERNFTLSPQQIAAINPNTKTAPVFRSRADAELTAKIYRNAPVLVEDGKGDEGNPWGVSFARLFDMSNDSGLFRTAVDLQREGLVRDGMDWVSPSSTAGVLPLAGGRDVGELDLAGGGPRTPQRYVPLYEAKMIHQFDHRWATYSNDGESASDVTLEDKTDPGYEPSPRYWVPEGEVVMRLAAKGWTRGWLMGWRDITNATNERTVIAAVFPRMGAGDTLLIKMPKAKDARICTANIENLCSLTLDYASRQKIGGTHLKYNIFKQLPVLPPAFYTEPRIAFIVPKVLELTYTSRSLAPFARDLGHDGPPFAWDEDRRALLRADLDAFYARAYGLTRDELRYILDPADVKGPDYPSETFRVLKKKEIRQHGEYRTRRLVLAAWDRMEVDGEFEAMEM